MKKITSLTAAQKARLPEFAARWTEIGLQTAPANRAEAERGVRLAYEIADLPAPKRIVWCGSPLSQSLTRAVVFGLTEADVSGRESVGESVWASVRESVRESVGASVWASVGASVGASVWESVRESVWESVRESVRESVWASVGASVGASVRESVGESVWASVGASVRESGYGQHDANWLGFYEYFADVCGLGEETQKLMGLWAVAKNAGWFLPHRQICWISERHNTLRRDDRGRLHFETGPALTYPDGWSIYAVHGVRVPARVVEIPASLTPAEIEDERNAEVRRVMIERFGQERFLLESGAQEIHRDDFGVLYRKPLVSDEPLVMVKVVNATPEPDGSFKDYFLRVDPELRPLPPEGMSEERARAWTRSQAPQEMTARNAVASTWSMRGEDYAPVLQT